MYERFGGSPGEVPDFEAAREHVLREVVRFARLLRRDGVSVPASATLPAVEALVRVGFDDRRRVRAALHATLVSDPRDSDVFEEHFEEFWYRLRTGLEATAAVDDTGERSDDADAETTLAGTMPTDPEEAVETACGDAADADPTAATRRIADAPAPHMQGEATDERLGTYSAAGDRSRVAGESVDTTIDRDALRRFERALATLSGRRWSRSRAGDAVDARRALRESLDTGGVALALPRRERDPTALRARVLVDVSQSVLDAVDRGFLLSVLDALVADGRSVRVFFFDTDIREVTDAFGDRAGDPAAALERAEVAWGGGTRIGGSLAGLRERWPHAVDRRTVTLVISDGLDVGDVATLRTGMAWLARRSGAVVWLNPLAATPGYEPTCRGMAAALPFVDGLFAFAGPADAGEIARQLERYGPDGPVGYEHDFRQRRGQP